MTLQTAAAALQDIIRASEPEPDDFALLLARVERMNRIPGLTGADAWDYLGSAAMFKRIVAGSLLHARQFREDVGLGTPRLVRGYQYWIERAGVNRRRAAEVR